MLKKKFTHGLTTDKDRSRAFGSGELKTRVKYCHLNSNISRQYFCPENGVLISKDPNLVFYLSVFPLFQSSN